MLPLETVTQTSVQQLAHVREILAQIPYIGQGGCGISALAIARWIRKSDMNASVIFVLGQQDPNDYRKNSASLIYESEPTSCTHIGVIIYDHDTGKQQIVDAKSQFDMFDYAYLTSYRSEELLVKALNVVCDWNTMFDRKRYVPFIEKHLKISLSDVDCRTKSEYLKERANAKPEPEPKPESEYEPESLRYEMLFNLINY